MRNNPDYAGAVLASYGLMLSQALIQILLIPLYLDALGTYRFGVLTILLAQVIFGSVVLNWPHGFLLRRFSESIAAADAGAFGRYYACGKVVMLVSSLVCAAAMLLFETVHPVFFDDSPPELRGEIMQAMALAALHFLLLCELSVEQSLLAAAKRQLAVNLAALVSVGVFVVCVVPWLLTSGGLVGIMVCFVVSDLAMRIVVWAVRRSSPGLRAPFRLAGMGAAMREMLSSQGGKYLLYSLLAISLQSDLLFVGAWGGPETAARFALVWKIAEMLVQVLARITQHLQPEFVSMEVAGEGARLARIYRAVRLWLVAAGLAAAAGYGLFGPWVVRLWVGEGRAPDESYLYVLAGVAILWVSLSRLPAVLAQAMFVMRGLLWLSAAELAAKLALIALLFPYYGVAAPLLAISATHLFGAALGYWLLGRSLLARVTRPA